MLINDMQFAMLTIQLSTLGQTDLRENDHEALQTLQYLLEEALNNVRGAITVRPEVQYRTIEVTMLGVDVPVEVECTGMETEDELYAMAKDLLRRTL